MIIIDDICKKHKVLFFFPLGFEVDVDFSWRSFQLLLLCDASIRIDFLLILSGDKNDCPEYRRLIFFFHLFFFVGNWSSKLGGKKVEQNNSRSRHSFSLFSQQIPAQSEELYIYIYTHIDILQSSDDICIYLKLLFFVFFIGLLSRNALQFRQNAAANKWLKQSAHQHAIDQFHKDATSLYVCQRFTCFPPSQFVECIHPLLLLCRRRRKR